MHRVHVQWTNHPTAAASRLCSEFNSMKKESLDGKKMTELFGSLCCLWTLTYLRDSLHSSLSFSFTEVTILHLYDISVLPWCWLQCHKLSILSPVLHCQASCAITYAYATQEQKVAFYTILFTLYSGVKSIMRNEGQTFFSGIAEEDTHA